MSAQSEAMQDKKELIRRAAVKVIAEHGFHEATTRMIATTAGVAIGSIYNYFSSKEDILAYIVEVERSRRVEFLRRIVQSDLPPRDKLRSFLEMHFRQVSEDPDTVRLVMREFHFSNREELEPLRSYFREIPVLLSRIVGEGLDEDDAHLRGIALFGAVQAFTLETLISPESGSLTAESVTEALTGLFLVG
ncbi:MAG: TetR/AcrR family transcriptional regulator [Chloroflexota bacterium]